MKNDLTKFDYWVLGYGVSLMAIMAVDVTLDPPAEILVLSMAVITVVILVGAYKSLKTKS